METINKERNLQDEKMKIMPANKSGKSSNSENPASDKWEIPSDWDSFELIIKN